VKFPTSGRFGGDLNGGECYGAPGVVGWQCKFNLSSRDPPARVCDVRLTRIVVVVVEMESVRLCSLYSR
jgi:hypothetical protein